jgi:hypothetical protein
MPLAVLVALAGALAGCTYGGFGSLDGHYATFAVAPPDRAAVEVCHAYGCQRRTRVVFTDPDLAEIKALMIRTRAADTPAEERRAIAYAIGWIERRVGGQIGTSSDRPGMDFAGSGDPTQQDCVDEATNTTSYLVVLANAGLVHHHRVAAPFAKENYLRGVSGWTHWTAVIEETRTRKRFAVDSWIHANGENPAIVAAETWYLAGLESLPAPTN